MGELIALFLILAILTVTAFFTIALPSLLRSAQRHKHAKIQRLVQSEIAAHGSMKGSDIRDWLNEHMISLDVDEFCELINDLLEAHQIEMLDHQTRLPSNTADRHHVALECKYRLPMRPL